MTSKEKLAALLDYYTRAWKECEEDPKVTYDDGAFRELCRDLHGELGAHIEASRPKMQAERKWTRAVVYAK